MTQKPVKNISSSISWVGALLRDKEYLEDRMYYLLKSVLPGSFWLVRNFEVILFISPHFFCI